MLAEPLVLAEPVMGALRLAAVSRQALTLGLRPGLTLADARARIPHLVAADHDPSADSALLVRMAESCERWTPLVALDAPDGLLLDVTGCDHLFGGEALLRDDILGRLHRGGFSARATLAGTPDTARALARFGRATVVPPGGEEEAARPLPVAALGLSEAINAALSLSGLKRLADLADLPSRPLVARFGEGLSVRLRCVLGREDRRITPLRPSPAFRVERALAEPITHADAIEDTLRWLIGQVADKLDQAGQGGRVFEAAFFRSDGTMRRIGVETGRPSRNAGAVLRLFRERLDALSDPLDPGFGFDLVRLGVVVCEPLRPHQFSLEDGTAEEDELSALVDRLVARLGPSRVLRFAAADTHDPRRSSRLVQAGASSPAAWPAPEPGEPPARPLQIFDPPQPIETLAEVPDGPPLRFRWRHVLHKVVHAEGPERIATEWWRSSDEPTRDYFRVEDEEGRRFWLFRSGLYGRETDRPRWYLHGLFA